MRFLIYFEPIFYAVFSIFIVAVVSGILVRKKKISQNDISSLSHITINILLPCLIFSKIVKSFNPGEIAYWWAIPLIAFAMIGLGIGISAIFYLRSFKKNKANIGMAAFMNANYMVLPIGQLAFADNLDLFITYVFLFVLGVSPALWSLGKYMVTSNTNQNNSIIGLLTPPFVANILAVLIVLLGIHNYIPEIVLKPINFIGEAAIPVATIVLGALIGSISFRKLPSVANILIVVSTKLIILPLVVIIILKYTQFSQINSLLADILVIQASVAPATQIMIQVKKYGGDVQQIGSMMLINYIFCLITIPMWFTLWKYLQY